MGGGRLIIATLAAAVAVSSPCLAADEPADEKIPLCIVLPPVEEIEVAKLPPILRAAIGRDIGDVALPGAPYDNTDVVKLGVNKRLIWVRKQGTRWVVAYEQGGRPYRDFVVSYEIGYDGSIAGVRKEVAFPATVCELTERNLWR